MNSRGVALYFVLAILLVVVILANIILTFITSQTRLTGHQVKRIQAYYAAQAGMNLALEMLRNNDPNWITTDTAKVRRICRRLNECSAPNLTEPSFPPSVNYVEIFIGPLDGATQSRVINTTVNYTSVY